MGTAVELRLANGDNGELRFRVFYIVYTLINVCFALPQVLEPDCVTTWS